MADALTESIGPMAQEDENYLDFELGDGHIQPVGEMTGKAVVDGGDSNEASAQDFDVQIDELSEGDDHNGNGEHLATNGDAPHGELGVPQDNVTVSEIDYDEEEGEDEGSQAATHLTASHGRVADQTQGENDVDNGDNVDEITYDDADVGVSKATASAQDADEALESALDPEVAQQDSVAQDSVLEPTNGGLNGDGSDHGVEGQNEDDEHLDEVSDVEENSVEHELLADHSNGDHTAEDDNMDDGKPLHNVIATYRGQEYELFASRSNSDPDTYFFARTDEMDFPLWELFESIRGVLRDEVQPTDELIISIEDLDLEIRSSSDENFLSAATMRDLLNLYLQLQENDGVTDEPNLFIQLIARPSCEERYRILSEAAGAGKGLSEFYNSPEQSEMASGHYSDGESVGGSASPAERPEGVEEDDEMGEMEDVGVVEQAFFIDDTNIEVDVQHDDLNGLYQGDEGDELSTHENETDQQHLLHKDTVDEQHNEADNGEDNYTGETQADDEHISNPEQNAVDENGQNEDVTYDDAAHTEVSLSSAFEQAGAEVASRTGGSEIGEGLEEFTAEVESGVAASDPFANGKDPLPVHPVVRCNSNHENPGYEQDDESSSSFWRSLGLSQPSQPLDTPRNASSSHGNRDLIDYPDDDEPMTSSRTSPLFFTPDGLLSYTPAHESLIDYSDDEDMSSDYHEFGDYEFDQELRDLLKGEDESFAPSSNPSVRSASGHNAPASDGVSSSSPGDDSEAAGIEDELATHSMLFGPLTMSASERCAIHFPLSYNRRHSRGHLNSQPSSATFANLPDTQAQHNLDTQSETGNATDAGSIGQPSAEDDANDATLDVGGEVDYFIATEDATNDGAPSEPDHADSSKATSNTATLHGDEDEIDYDEDDDEPVTQHADVEVDAAEGATNELDEIDWMNDEVEVISNHDQDTTNHVSPGSSAKRQRDVDEGTGVNDESDTPAKRQKL